jgi:hypothetical protein
MKNQIDVFCSGSKREKDEIENFLIPSLLKQEYEGNINLTLINYNKGESFYDGPRKISNLTINEVSPKKQLGFGAAHNYAFRKVKPEDLFLVTNPGFLHEQLITSLLDTKDTGDGIVEARQLPFSHPKRYYAENKVPWAAGSCALFDSALFGQLGGFDEGLWMYLEDVDISWRTWLSGYNVKIEPKAVIYHFTGAYFGYSDNRYYLEHFWSARNFFYILYKYWGKAGERKARKFFKKVGYPEKFKQEVLGAFDEVKPQIKRCEYSKKQLSELAKYIKVKGYNLFHEINDE